MNNTFLISSNKIPVLNYYQVNTHIFCETCKSSNYSCQILSEI